MRYFLFYQNYDGCILGIIAIISKNRCSLSDCKVLTLYAFRLNKVSGRRKISQLFWPNLIKLISVILLLIHFLRSLI